MTTAPSRRRFLRSAGLVTGGVLLARHLPAEAFAGRFAGGQGAAQAADPLADIRAKMGAAAIESTPLGQRLVMLSGPGGNVVVLHGPDGKVVVDSFLQPAWPRLKQALDALDSGPVKTLVDTHWHFDHTDNNGNFRAAGASVVAHVNTKKRMTEPHELLGMQLRPSPPDLLPTQTFSNRQGIEANGERMELSSVPPAHTDTDIFVHYRRANVLHMGDVFFNGVYPVIDGGTGGSINGMIAGAERALALVNPRTKIVPGHGPLGDRAALEAYRTMLATVRDRVQKLKRAGRTLAEVQAARPAADYDETWGKGLLPPDAFLAMVYNTL